MRYPPSVLDEIRARLPVSAVVGKRVQLRKAGREWKALSPFQAERTPSFFVNDQKGFYHCFSSGRHGDIFRFLMETEGLSFPEAVERLAAEAGVALPKVSAEAELHEARRKTLHETLELAAAFYETRLAGPGGRAARDYLAGRGIGAETQRLFRLGYAPADRYALRDHLAGKGVALDLMLEAGLLVAAEGIAVPYDRFRDRVMFPIADGRGRVVGFGGRALSADVPAKYLNSPDTPLFSKGSLLYNLDKARAAAHARGTVILVEGYVDVIALAMAGFPHTVAPLGTALTEEQLALLWRLADEPVLCFDGDGAGRRAAFRAIDLALPALAPGKSLRFALLPQGQDPDDLVRDGGGAAFERVLATALPLIDLLWARERAAGPLDTPERLAGFERRLKAAVATIADESLRRHYGDAVAERLESLRPARPSRFGRSRSPRPGLAQAPRWREAGKPAASLRPSPELARNPLFAGGPGASPREALLMSLLLAHPELLHDCAEPLAELAFSSRDAEDLRGFLLQGAASGEPPDPATTAARLGRAGLAEKAERLAAAVRPGDRWSLAADADPQRVQDTLRQAIVLHRRARTLHSELRAAERALAAEESDANLAWLQEVQRELSSLDGAEADLDASLGG